MTNPHFNTDGPISVSSADFESYQQLTDNADFDDLYYLWIDESQSNGVRRLCLRDMLRQSNPDIHTSYHYTTYTFARLLSIGGRDRPKELYWQLHNRPKLLKEFIEEFRWTFNQPSDNPVNGDDTTRSKYALLELIFQLTDQNTGLEFLPLYDVWDTKQPTAKGAMYLIDNWSNPHNPDWFRENCYKTFSDAITSELQHSGIVKAQDAKILPNCLTYNEPAILAALNFIGQFNYKAHKKDLTPVKQLFSLIHQNLPARLCITSINVLIPILYNLPDPADALGYLSRQIANDCLINLDTLPLQEVRNFYFWAYGLISSRNPCNAEQLLAKLKSAYDATIPIPRK